MAEDERREHPADLRALRAEQGHCGAVLRGVNAPSPISWHERDEAGFLSLRVVPRSAEAKALVDGLFEDVVEPAWPSDLAKRPSSYAKHRQALGALLGDLLRLQTHGQAGKHGMRNENFNGLGFSRETFKRVSEALVAAGLLDILGGYRWFGGSIAAKGTVRGSTVSTFRLSDKALGLAEGAGLRPASLKDWLEDWDRPRASVPQSAPLIELRGQRERIGKRKSDSRPLEVDPRDPRVAALADELAEHNAFVAAKGVEGVLFAGLKRVFNNGDVPGFAWRWGGRFASLPGGGYERESKRDRLAVMRLAGEAVAELDLRASHLTLAYGLTGASFDPAATDPYSVESLDRELVKRWITQSIGRGDVDAGRWSDEAKAYYATFRPGRSLAKDVPFRAAREAILRAHPILAELERRPELAVHSLLFHESEILSQAMAVLRRAGVPSLPVHDCLIVPRSEAEGAQGALRNAFLDYLAHETGRPSTVTPAMTIEAA